MKHNTITTATTEVDVNWKKIRGPFDSLAVSTAFVTLDFSRNKLYVVLSSATVITSKSKAIKSFQQNEK